MEISHSELKRCDLIKVSGRVDSATAPELKAAIDEVLNNGHYKLVLDMNGVKFISSAGLGVLIATQKVCKRYNRGELVLADLQPNILSSIKLAGFVPLFKIFDDNVSAVGYF
ncbi:MAG TPA: STAS domain-containing protein [Bellilinea sp.]|nr:STAS domain-containing protein [Bellilinea sp.]